MKERIFYSIIAMAILAASLGCEKETEPACYCTTTKARIDITDGEDVVVITRQSSSCQEMEPTIEDGYMVTTICR